MPAADGRRNRWNPTFQAALRAVRDRRLVLVAFCSSAIPIPILHRRRLTFSHSTTRRLPYARVICHSRDDIHRAMR